MDALCVVLSILISPGHVNAFDAETPRPGLSFFFFFFCAVMLAVMLAYTDSDRSPSLKCLHLLALLSV